MNDKEFSLVAYILLLSGTGIVIVGTIIDTPWYIVGVGVISTVLSIIFYILSVRSFVSTAKELKKI